MSMALAALAVAVAFAGFARTHPTWWEASISLAVLAGIFPMILAVNTRIVPVFSRRDWVSPALIKAMVLLALAGGWIVFAGRVWGPVAADNTGQRRFAGGRHSFLGQHRPTVSAKNPRTSGGSVAVCGTGGGRPYRF